MHLGRLLGKILIGHRGLALVSETAIWRPVTASKIDSHVRSRTVHLAHLEVMDIDVAILIARPSGVTRWNGPYLKGENVPEDPWADPSFTTTRASALGMNTISTR